MTKTAGVNSSWWPVALSANVTGNAPTRCRLFGEDYVLFRDKTGVARALTDRCAHRRAPLSDGKITPEGWVECPYHGWRFDGQDGRCRSIPNLSADEPVPAGYGVDAFATRELGGFVFVAIPPTAGAVAPLPALDNAGNSTSHQGSAFLATPYRALMAALLDAPSLMLDIRGVQVVDDNFYGEPYRDNAGHFITERAADWTALARKRKKVVPDYPLQLRTETLPGDSITHLALHTDAFAPVLNATLAVTPVSDCVTAVHWQATVHKPEDPAFTPAVHRTLEKLDFTVPDAIDARTLLARHPYASSLWQDTLPGLLLARSSR